MINNSSWYEYSTSIQLLLQTYPSILKVGAAMNLFNEWNKFSALSGKVLSAAVIKPKFSLHAVPSAHHRQH